MSFFKDLPSPSSFFSAYASMAGYLMLIRSMVHDMIPLPVQDFIFSSLRSLFGSHSSTLTLTIDCDVMGMSNEIYDAAQTYLSTKISPEAATLRITKGPKDKHVNVYLSNGEIITDLYQGIELKWRFLCNGGDKKSDSEDIREYFELSFDKKHRDLVLNSYIQHVLSKANEIEDGRRILKMYTLNCLRWECVNLEHPSTFDTMAMDEELKRAVIDDLDRFIKRRDFYKRVGKAWKRGYLLYGPPGTGKSSLVAAMANYLKFDVYDLQLAGVMRDSDLRRLLLGTHNRSILVVEDIDCAVDLPNRLQAKEGDHGRVDLQGQLTLSGLLNFIDGLWSSCGDERIIIFTTNHKEKLDPALLRPGRMDMHIYMGHCTFQGFKTLASNYLGLPYADDSHHLYNEIEHTIQEAQVTPAQVAEELMKSEEIDVALEGLIKLLEKKGSGGEDDYEESKKAETEEKSNSQEKTKSKSDDTTTPRKSKGRSMKKLVLFWSFVC